MHLRESDRLRSGAVANRSTVRAIAFCLALGTFVAAIRFRRAPRSASGHAESRPAQAIRSDLTGVQFCESGPRSTAATRLISRRCLRQYGAVRGSTAGGSGYRAPLDLAVVRDRADVVRVLLEAGV